MHNDSYLPYLCITQNGKTHTTMKTMTTLEYLKAVSARKSEIMSDIKGNYKSMQQCSELITEMAGDGERMHFSRALEAKALSLAKAEFSEIIIK